MLKCVVAEDEALLRAELVARLREAAPDLDLVAVCEDGASALEAIAEHQPQFAFLDIRMPGISGLEVAAALAEASPQTQVVFVTAYEQHALDAFERGAVDYLLKPVAPERLAATLTRLRARMGQGGPDPRLLDTLLRQLGHSAPAKAPPLAWITASRGQETRLIMVEDVVYFQSDAKYTVVMTADGEALLRTPLRELLAVLDPAMFRQVHRSTIVNMRAVASVARDEAGRGRIRLKSRPEMLTVSQAFMSLFRNM
ncbi:LytTR family DNA-binding domain-containing protein [Massilia solisilvae]|uniref:LytTR family DNA-binding domain-containing protein n=1 Tax=Massilia solisilvae TaxID=1811225 RepID=A0ABT2BM20_9BURK|nr:LytTR family DNA-binding domain-containing protein [Massilia solisilvae]MCS0609544.1 LytTR family DNA-binding domain-containing protein [Massilia solisilvae]